MGSRKDSLISVLLLKRNRDFLYLIKLAWEVENLQFMKRRGVGYLKIKEV